MAENPTEWTRAFAHESDQRSRLKVNSKFDMLSSREIIGCFVPENYCFDGVGVPLKR